MIDIKLEESSNLTLEMNIEGARGAKPELRFSVMVEGMRLSFSGKSVGDGVYEIAFPKLNGRVTEGEYPAEVEVIVDGRYFAPLHETVNFIKEVKPTVSVREHLENAVRAPAMVTIGQVKKVTPPTLVENVRSLIAEVSKNREIDTAMVLRSLDAMAARESLTEGTIRIEPKAALMEAEALAVIRLISGARGCDLVADDPIALGNIASISEQVAGELRDLLSEKGLSARLIRQHGL